jgi:hypothetical protein
MDNILIKQLAELAKACQRKDVKPIICGGLGVYLSFCNKENDNVYARTREERLSEIADKIADNVFFDEKCAKSVSCHSSNTAHTSCKLTTDESPKNRNINHLSQRP